MERIYAVNVFGIARMTHAFLPLLRASASPVIVNVSSGLGSFGVVTDLPPPTSTATPATRPWRRGTDAIVRPATIGPYGPTGTFSSRTGPAPW